MNITENLNHQQFITNEQVNVIVPWMIRIIIPIFWLFGGFGNIFVILTISQHNTLRNNPLYFALLIIAVTDMIALFSNSWRVFIWLGRLKCCSGILKRFNSSVVWCRAQTFIQLTSYSLSNWLVAYVACGRLLLFHKRQPITHRFIRIGFIVLLLLSFICNFHYLLFYGHFEMVENSWKLKMCTLDSSGRYTTYSRIFRTVIYHFYSAVFVYLPLTFVIFTTIYIASAISSHVALSDVNNRINRWRRSASIRLLFGLQLLIFLINAPYYLVLAYWEKMVQMMTVHEADFIYVVNGLLRMISNIINFYFYIFMSNEFRQKFLQLLIKLRQ
ncbi:hypothetical protein SNEBB_008093 [Seison nebaliae]|nr:hypothetical protein SNEBB_008093 [Seison nebaliae]